MEVKRRKRPSAQNSNVFSLFTENQISEFKEAFSMIDQDNDGFIDKEDLQAILSSLGQIVTDEYIEAMLVDAQGPINFTMFLTLFGERLSHLDSEFEIISAFQALDPKKTGLISADYLRDLMTSLADKFSEDEFDLFLKGVQIDDNNCLNYMNLIQSLKS